MPTPANVFHSVYRWLERQGVPRSTIQTTVAPIIQTLFFQTFLVGVPLHGALRALEDGSGLAAAAYFAMVVFSALLFSPRLYSSRLTHKGVDRGVQEGLRPTSIDRRILDQRAIVENLLFGLVVAIMVMPLSDVAVRTSVWWMAYAAGSLTAALYHSAQNFVARRTGAVIGTARDFDEALDAWAPVPVDLALERLRQIRSGIFLDFAKQSRLVVRIMSSTSDPVFHRFAVHLLEDHYFDEHGPAWYAIADSKDLTFELALEIAAIIFHSGMPENMIKGVLNKIIINGWARFSQEERDRFIETIEPLAGPEGLMFGRFGHGGLLFNVFNPVDGLAEGIGAIWALFIFPVRLIAPLFGSSVLESLLPPSFRASNFATLTDEEKMAQLSQLLGWRDILPWRYFLARRKLDNLLVSLVSQEWGKDSVPGAVDRLVAVARVSRHNRAALERLVSGSDNPEADLALRIITVDTKALGKIERQRAAVAEGRKAIEEAGQWVKYFDAAERQIEEPRTGFALPEGQGEGATGGNIGKGFTEAEIDALLARSQPADNYRLEQAKRALLADLAERFGARNYLVRSIRDSIRRPASYPLDKIFIEVIGLIIRTGSREGMDLDLRLSPEGVGLLRPRGEYLLEALKHLRTVDCYTFTSSEPGKISPLSVQGDEKYLMETNRTTSAPGLPFGIYYDKAFETDQELFEQLPIVLLHAALEGVTPQSKVEAKALAIHKAIYQQIQDPIFKRAPGDPSPFRAAVRAYMGRRLREDFNGEIRRALVERVHSEFTSPSALRDLLSGSGRAAERASLSAREIAYLKDWHDILNTEPLPVVLERVTLAEDVDGFHGSQVFQIGARERAPSALRAPILEAAQHGIRLVVLTGDPAPKDVEYWRERKMVVVSRQSLLHDFLSPSEKSDLARLVGEASIAKARLATQMDRSQAHGLLLIRLVVALTKGQLTEERAADRTLWWSELDEENMRPDERRLVHEDVTRMFAWGFTAVESSPEWDPEAFLAGLLPLLDEPKLPAYVSAEDLEAQIQQHWLKQLIAEYKSGRLNFKRASALYHDWYARSERYKLVFGPYFAEGLPEVAEALNVGRWRAETYIPKVRDALFIASDGDAPLRTLTDTVAGSLVSLLLLIAHGDLRISQIVAFVALGAILNYFFQEPAHLAAARASGLQARFARRGLDVVTRIKGKITPAIAAAGPLAGAAAGIVLIVMSHLTGDPRLGIAGFTMITINVFASLLRTRRPSDADVIVPAIQQHLGAAA